NDHWSVSVEATDSTALENSDDYGVWTISRSGESDATHALTVLLARSGSADYSYGNGDYAVFNASGYQLYNDYFYDSATGSYRYGYSVSIPAGATSTTLELRPLNDTETEALESATLSVEPNAAYSIDARRSTATIHILDDESNAPVLSLAPTNLTATAVGYRSVSLEWDATEGAVYYVVERSYDGGAVWETLVGSVATAAYVDSTIAVNAEATYRVRAANAAGFSPASVVLGSGTPFLPPSDLTVEAVGVDSLALSWTPYDVDAGVVVERSTDGSDWVVVAENCFGTRYLDEGLTADRAWFYRVSSRLSSVGASAPSNAVSFFFEATIPETPSSLGATLLAADAISLTWSSVPGATAYLVERSTDGASWTTVAEVAQSKFDDASPSLDATTSEYRYRVSARNSAGTSAASVAIQAKPAAVVSIEALAQTSNSLTLSWENGVSNFPFRLERSTDGDVWTTVASDLTETTYVDADLTADATYFYRVCLQAGVPSDWTTTSARTYPNAPNAPTLVVSSTVDSATISWNAVDGATSYSLERSLDSQHWTPIASGLTDATYVDSNLESRVDYFYRAFAVNLGGVSSPSSVVSTTTATRPPEILAVEPMSQTELRVVWNEPLGAESFRLERSTDGGETWSARLDATRASSFVDSNLTPGAHYVYRVVAVWSEAENYISSPVGEYAFAPRWIVGVEALDDFATESGDDFGSFVLTRVAGKDATVATEAFFTLSGSAAPSDYAIYDASGKPTSPTEREVDGETLVVYSATIPPGATSVALELRPSSDSTSERAELVSLRLLADDAYDLDADAATAVVHIVDAEPLLRVDVDDKVAGENDAASNFGSFVVSRQSASALSSPTTLAFSLSGSAIYGVDYTLSSEASLSLDADFNGSLVIPAGATSATISIVPLDDATREELETVVLTLVESDGYGVCVNASSGTVFLT
ncbi:MAG: hypothetical protein IKW13_00425, partial [Thermoguttaceae bacterium]|nr:hypothetical protein [Thermoguttaceae bacterium]